MLSRLIAASCLVLTTAACAYETAAPTATSEQALDAAAFTTFDRNTGCCLDPDGAACSHYASKSDVYLAPPAGLGDGEYFFAVVLPSHQTSGMFDGLDGNLSDPVSGATAGDLGVGDFVEDRTFAIIDGKISQYGGSHVFGSSPDGRRVIALAPFDEASELDGKYVVAVCRADATSAAGCWFDAFEIVEGAACAKPSSSFARMSRRSR